MFGRAPDIERGKGFICRVCVGTFENSYTGKGPMRNVEETLVLVGRYISFVISFMFVYKQRIF